MTEAYAEPDDLGLPDHLTDEARDLVSGVLEDLDESGEEPDALTWGALLQAAELISTADRLDEVARAADYMATGSQGQKVLHPAVAESRQARAAAAATITRLRPKQQGGATRFAPGAGGSASRAAAARWGQARSGGRSRKGRG